MPTNAQLQGLPINMSAWKLAMKAGQRIEILLLQRADQLAKEENSSAVTLEHVRASVTEDLLSCLQEFLDEYDGSQLRRAG